LTPPALLAHIHPQIANKALLVLILLGASVGTFHFLTKHVRIVPWAAIGAGTFYAVNPFVYDRMLAGQILLLAGYALLPWALPSLLRMARAGTGIARAIGWTVLVGVVDVHVGGMVLLLFVAALIASPADLKAKAVSLLVCGAAIVAVHTYWVVPSVLAGESERLGAGDLLAYAPRPRSASILPHELILHGFWRLEFETPMIVNRGRFLAAFLPLALVSFYGISRSTGARRWARPAAALLAACIIALVLGMGRSFPLTEPLARWLYDNVPGYGIYREPQKWVGLVALGYALFLGVGLDRIAELLGRVRPRASAVVALAAVLPLVATSVMLWGFGGRLQTSEFPEGWYEADERTAGQEGRLVLFPWHLYQPISFAGHRTIANPAHHFFKVPVLISDDPELFVAEETSPADPRDLYVGRLLAGRRRVESFGHLVAPLGARWVGLAHVSDFGSYRRFLARQNDLDPVFEGGGFTLYENRAWEGDSYGLADGPEDEGRVGELLRDPGAQVSVTDRFTRLESPELGGALPGLSFAKALPIWDRVASVDDSIIGTSNACRDGWRLEDRDAMCNLGSLAAFPAGNGGGALWRPGLVVQLACYAVSLTAGIVLGVACLRSRRMDREEPPGPAGGSRSPSA
jgi:hypothetical protein